jgi:hypothetical protein
MILSFRDMLRVPVQLYDDPIRVVSGRTSQVAYHLSLPKPSSLRYAGGTRGHCVTHTRTCRVSRSSFAVHIARPATERPVRILKLDCERVCICQPQSGLSTLSKRHTPSPTTSASSRPPQRSVPSSPAPPYDTHSTTPSPPHSTAPRQSASYT